MSAHIDVKGKFYTEVVTKSKVYAVIHTNQHRIYGALHVREHLRVSDAVHSSGDFLAITDATVQDHQGYELFESEFLMINRRHIIWIDPEDDHR